MVSIFVVHIPPLHRSLPPASQDLHVRFVPTNSLTTEEKIRAEKLWRERGTFLPLERDKVAKFLSG